MKDKSKEQLYKTLTFSKDNSVLEIASKQSQTQSQNIKPPVKPKETKKE